VQRALEDVPAAAARHRITPTCLESTMSDKNSTDPSVTRRDFLKATGMGAVALGVGLGGVGAAFGNEPTHASASGDYTPGKAPSNGQYNILFILVDQERMFRPGELPIGFSLPGHERLMKSGTTFLNHRINSCVCTSSRSVVYTGRHIQQTRMFDNTNFPWIQSLSTEMPTVGKMLREAGYYTAYKGKWHLTKEFETVNKLGSPTKIFTEEMEAYGFSDYFGVGDIIAHNRGGYKHDGIIASMGVSWLRGKGRELAGQGKPWFLAVNLVNPHDVMFYDTDAPGTPLRKPPGLAPIERDPVDPLYAKRWDFDLPASHNQALNAPGRPTAHRDYLQSHDWMVAPVANEEARWRRRHNYYLNCIRDVDRNIAAVLAELDAAGLAESTIVILTADHGDLDGAHQLHSKGASAYREQNNVPLIVSHPAFSGGKQCRALTSHLDLAPTFVALANTPADKRKSLTAELPGKDFSGLLAAPERAEANTLHEAVLFNYNMFAYLDGEFMRKGVEFLHSGGNPKELVASGVRPDMMKRGAVRSVFDGRYVFSRYFSPKQHNTPGTFEELYKFNDVELFDTASDPHEMNNLAVDKKKSAELALAMNAKMNRLIAAEVGEDRGQMLPGGIDAGWEVTPETMAGF
jgi:arylsulfatase